MHERFIRWAAGAVRQRVFTALSAEWDNGHRTVDSAIVRAHTQAVTGKKRRRGGSRALPRQTEHRDRLAVDRRARPVRFVLTRGERDGITLAPALLAGSRPAFVPAARGDDRRTLVASIEACGAVAAIAPHVPATARIRQSP